MNDDDTILFCQRFITMTERFERAQPGEIEIAEETGRVALPRFNQGHLDSRGADGEISGDRCAADAAADHDDTRLGLAPRLRLVERR